MSRVGKQPIILPDDVEVTLQGPLVTAKGPLGLLERSLHPDVAVRQEDHVLTVVRPSDSSHHKALHGLTRTLVANMVEGVTKGFKKNLEVVGVGYRVQKAGEKLVLQVGYSHPVEVAPPSGITFQVEGTNRISVLGIDKELVGETAAKIRFIRPPEPYKGKGIRYEGEILRSKAGKSGRVGSKKGK